MAGKDFVVKNGLIVNTSFVANSTVVGLGTINSTSNGIVFTPSLITIGNSSVNATINSTAFSGTSAVTATVSNTFTVGTASYFVANGNLGIANNSPSEKLEVNGNVKITPALNGGLKINQSGGTLNGFIGPSDLGGFAVGTQTADSLVLFSNNAARMTVVANGQVSITASNTLSDVLIINRSAGSGVTSGINLQTAAGASGDGSYIKWTGANTAEKVASIDGVMEGTDLGSIRFNTGNGSDSFQERMRITATGNVGIGSTATDSKLKVVASAGNNGLVVTDSSTSDFIVAPGVSSAVCRVGPASGAMALFTGGSERARLPAGGGFSVGTTADPGAGAIYATGNITAYYSDERLKIRKGNIENALEKVKALSGFYYEANELAQSLGYEATPEVGVSAQEVQAVMPEIVVPAPIDDKYLTVRYEKLVPLLIEAIKELENRVKELESK